IMNQVNEAPPQLLSPPSAEELQRRLERAERLLACFGKAVGHELPNQLVAVQGWLRELELDAADRLPPETRKELDHLAAVLKRTQTLIAALARLSRVGRNPQPAEPVDLAEVSNVAAAEVKQLFPAQPFGYDIAEGSPTLIVPYAALRQ